MSWENRIMYRIRSPEPRRIFATLLGSLVLITVGTTLAAQQKPDNAPGEETKKKTASHKQPSATSQPSNSAGASKTAPKTKTSQDPEPPREASPAEILKRLQQDTRRLPRPVTHASNHGSLRRRVQAPNPDDHNAIRPAAHKLLPDGSRIVDRPGRLTSEGEYFTFSFESRGRGAPELPIRLLPNRLLEDMEIASAGGTKNVVFVVSGEVTEYRGVNYLLVQKLLVRPNMGNFK